MIMQIVPTSFVYLEKCLCCSFPEYILKYRTVRVIGLAIITSMVRRDIENDYFSFLCFVSNSTIYRFCGNVSMTLSSGISIQSAQTLLTKLDDVWYLGESIQTCFSITE